MEGNQQRKINKSKVIIDKTKPLKERREKMIEILNYGSLDELCLLKHVGIKTAERIILYRNSNHGIATLCELLNILHLGNTKLLNILKANHLIEEGHEEDNAVIKLLMLLHEI